MWQYLTGKAGDLNFEYQGTRVYIGADRVWGVSPMENAVSKVVRAIIESKGGDGRSLKQSGKVWGSYRKGYVLWEGKRAAEWKEEAGTMEFTEDGKEFEAPFRALMQSA